MRQSMRITVEIDGAIEIGIRVYPVDQHFLPMQDILGLRLYTPGYGGLPHVDNFDFIDIGIP
jgi:hypothetical protein